MTTESREIVKRGKRTSEPFQTDKLKSSIVAACLSVQAPIRQAELVAESVCHHVIAWLESRPEVTSDDVRRIAAKHLTIHHPDAAYLYEQQPVTI